MRCAALALAVLVAGCAVPAPAPLTADYGPLLHGYTPGGFHTRRIGP